MATISIPKRVCDRPGCGKVVTEKGGRVCMTAAGLDTIVAEGNVPDDPFMAGYRTCSEEHSADLCRDCITSIVGWWTSKQYRQRRAAAKEGASQ